MLRSSFRIFSKLFHKDAQFKNSTVFALSSGYGKCGVAVVRVSGPDSRSVLSKMAGFDKLPPPRKVSLRLIKNPLDNTVLDRGLVIWFPGPQSFTGEDCCELQIHGGKAVVSAVLKSLSEMPNFRPAAPGEFTKRAFYSNKLDLTEVEGLADLIEAETEAQRKQALNQMSGALSKVYNSWKLNLTQTVARIEAYIDFSESENIEEDLIQQTKESIRELVISIQKHLSDGRRGERLRDGVQTVILGAPNVGKSSLLNLLCRKDEAIVSSIAGTTRDIVTSCIDIGGYPLVIKDTAGLRKSKNPSNINILFNKTTIDSSENIGIVLSSGSNIVDNVTKDASDFGNSLKNCDSFLNPTERSVENAPECDKKASEIAQTTDPVEIEGISRAIKAANSSDLILLLMDPTHLPPSKPLKQSIADYISKLGISDLISNCDSLFNRNNLSRKCLLVLNKVDLIENRDVGQEFDAVISCSNSDGVEDLLKILTSHLVEMCGRGDIEDISCNQIRHRHCLVEVLASLEECLSTMEPDLMAHHIRQAMFSLGKITGHISTEQILDVIFKQFCIGK